MWQTLLQRASGFKKYDSYYKLRCNTTLFTITKKNVKLVHLISRLFFLNLWSASSHYKKQNLPAKNLGLYRNYDNHVVNQKHQQCKYCFNKGKKNRNCIAYSYWWSLNVFLCVQKDRNCFKFYHAYWERTYYDYGLTIATFGWY